MIQNNISHAKPNYPQRRMRLTKLVLSSVTGFVEISIIWLLDSWIGKFYRNFKA